jgi:hypothetical protein
MCVLNRGRYSCESQEKPPGIVYCSSSLRAEFMVFVGKKLWSERKKSGLGEIKTFERP